MNHYATLGLTSDASNKEVKEAYRKLASKYHPDKGGDTAKFQELQTSYDAILRGEGIADENVFRNMHRSGFSGFNDLNDFFRGMGGNNPGFNQRNPNPDINLEIPCTLEEAHAGFAKDIEFTLPNGEQRQMKVTFPLGTTSDIKIRHAGAGAVLVDSEPPGDLYIRARIQEHPIWKIHGMDLYTSIQISVWQAMLGNFFPIKDINGDTLTVGVPAGTQPGTQLRLKNKGLNIRGKNQRTNAFVIVNVIIPKLDEGDENKPIIDLQSKK